MSVAPVPIVGVSLGHRHQKTAISVTETGLHPDRRDPQRLRLRPQVQAHAPRGPREGDCRVPR